MKLGLEQLHQCKADLENYQLIQKRSNKYPIQSLGQKEQCSLTEKIMRKIGNNTEASKKKKKCKITLEGYIFK